MRNTQKKGFTLIELMIVISIIWILAITLLPQLQWAQERARDAGRIANINSIEAVLNTYYWDEWSFPSTPTGVAADWCLSTTDWVVNADLTLLFKWWFAPIDTQKNMVHGDCNSLRSYSYHALDKNWVPNNSYILLTDVESFKKGNFTISGLPTPWTWTMEKAAAGDYWTWGVPTQADETADPKTTVYASIN